MTKANIDVVVKTKPTVSYCRNGVNSPPSSSVLAKRIKEMVAAVPKSMNCVPLTLLNRIAITSVQVIAFPESSGVVM